MTFMPHVSTQAVSDAASFVAKQILTSQGGDVEGFDFERDVDGYQKFQIKEQAMQVLSAAQRSTVLNVLHELSAELSSVPLAERGDKLVDLIIEAEQDGADDFNFGSF